MCAAFIFHFPINLRWQGLLLTFLLVAFKAGEPAIAMNSRCVEPVFGVSNILIDQRADTASIAQETGLRKAAERAFSIVLGRVLLSDDARRQFMASNDLDDFSDFIHIVEENNLEQRYIATLDFCFDAIRLRHAMDAAQLSWSELQSPPILVIPVWQGPDGARAWHRDNLWITGWWDAIGAYNGLLSFRQLDRNLTNERQFRGEDLALADPIKIEAAARLVNAEEVLLVIASLDYNGSKPEISITAQLFDKTGQMITHILHSEVISSATTDMNATDLVRKKIIKEIETSWHMANLIDNKKTEYMTVFLPVSSVKEWAERLSALDEIAVIKSYDIISLNTSVGQVLLNLAGSRGALQNALAAHRLQLVDEGYRQLISAKSNNR